MHILFQLMGLFFFQVKSVFKSHIENKNQDKFLQKATADQPQPAQVQLTASNAV